MDKTEELLRKLGHKTMFNLTDDEMKDLVEEYNVFMNHVKILEEIDTEGVDPLAFPYEIETTYLRDDSETRVISREDALKNAKEVKDNQIKVPKVVG